MIKIDKDFKGDVWIFSDPHYNHKNICRGTTNWQMPDGSVPIEQTRDFQSLEKMNAAIGNHDHHIENNRQGCQGYFKSVTHYNTLKIDEHTFRLMHYPISSWDGLNKGVMHLHGHCHLPTNLRFGKGQRMDVGMDGNGMDEVVPLLRHRPKVSEMDNDHHTDEIINKDQG